MNRADMHTRMGTHTHMGEPRDARDTCMGSPYAYGLRKMAHMHMGRPYAYGTAHMRTGKIRVWDGTCRSLLLQVCIAKFILT